MLMFLMGKQRSALTATQLGIFTIFCLVVGIARSVYRLATICTIRGSNPGGDEIFRTHPERPWGPHSLLYNRYRVSAGG
jgi:hypothetical protein